jgi:hypothetical protein
VRNQDRLVILRSTREKRGNEGDADASSLFPEKVILEALLFLFFGR